jgi:hypothetical protein
MREVLRFFRSWWPLLGAILVGVLIAAIQAGNLPSRSFYGMAAEVIPVLIVALAVESRARNFWDRMPNVFNLQIVLFLAVGELSAILAVSGVMDTSDYYDPGVVGPTVGISYAMLGATVAGLGAGFIAVLVLALRGALAPSEVQTPRL